MSHISSDGQYEVQPVWWLEFRRLFEAGLSHCFVVSGDIHGVTAFHGLSQQTFLSVALSGAREVVAQYHPATGITFPQPSMRDLALETLGPNWQPPASDDPYAAALDLAGVSAHQEDVFAAARKPSKALAILDQLLHAPTAARCEARSDGSEQIQGRVAVVVDHADLIVPAATKAQLTDDRLAILATLLAWGQDPVLARQQNPILLLTALLSELHPDLLESSSGYRVIAQPLPDEPTRRAYLSWYLEEHRRADPIPLLDLSPEDLVRTTAGLNLRQLEDVLLAGANPGAARSTNPEAPLGVRRKHVKERKDAIIRQQFSEVVEMLEPLPGGFADLGGVETFTTWFVQEVLTPLRSGVLHEVPKGILLVGPPGTGKTLLVRAASAELGFHAIQLHMANILAGIVGASERNLQKVFHLARDLAPTFFFIDEIDQTLLAQRGESSGSPVAANLFGAMLQFLGDESLRGRVIVVGATNQPGRLDPALRRPGRFEVTFPIVSPDRAARWEILTVQALQQRVHLAPEAQQLLAEETEHYSAADLAAVLKEAGFLARLAGGRDIGILQAQAALENVRPATLANVEGYNRSAIELCTNVRYLPPAVAEAERTRLAAQRRSAAARPVQPSTSARAARQL